jgi:hypothetical protein
MAADGLGWQLGAGLQECRNAGQLFLAQEKCGNEWPACLIQQLETNDGIRDDLAAAAALHPARTWSRF